MDMTGLWTFLKSNKWMRVIYVIVVIGFFVWLITGDQSFSCDEQGISCDSNSNVNVDIKK